MRRHRVTTELEPDRVTKMATELAEVLAERSRGNKELRIAMADAIGENGKREKRFRNAVLIRLSRIEATVGMTHGAQLVQGQKWEPGYEEKIQKDAEASEEFISRKSDELGLAMVKYVYGESEEPGAPRDKRQKWSDWKI